FDESLAAYPVEFELSVAQDDAPCGLDEPFETAACLDECPLPTLLREDEGQRSQRHHDHEHTEERERQEGDLREQIGEQSRACSEVSDPGKRLHYHGDIVGKGHLQA